MKKIKNEFCYLIPMLLIWLSTACLEKQAIRAEDFDQPTWKEDHQGCLAKRKHVVGQIIAIKHKFIGYNELEIRNLLGKPNQIELAERNKKYYYYYVEPGKQCQDTIAFFGKRLQVRFNALNQVDEIIVLEK